MWLNHRLTYSFKVVRADHSSGLSEWLIADGSRTLSSTNVETVNEDYRRPNESTMNSLKEKRQLSVESKKILLKRNLRVSILFADG